MATLTKRALAGFAAAGAAALVLAGCSGASGGDYLACAVSDEGSWNDKSFNEAVYDGLQLAESELGVDIAEAESNTPEDFGPNLEAMLDANCDVIFGVGFTLIEDINAAAAANPDVNFVTVDGYSMENPNLKPVNYAMAESSYLAGYLAAAYSTTKTVGTYGGMQIPAVTDFMDGYYYGAMAYAEESGEDVTVVGWDPMSETGDFTGDFVPNSATSKSIAASQIEAGADVIFPVGGDQFGAGSEAITEAGIEGVMIGVDKDIALTSPEYAEFVLTSAEKRMTQATYDIIEQAAAGNFNGDIYLGTLANGGTDLSPFYDFDAEVPQEVKDRLAEIKQGIIDGEIDPLS